MMRAGGPHTEPGPTATRVILCPLRPHLHPRRGATSSRCRFRPAAHRSRFTTRFRKSAPTFGNALGIGTAPVVMSAARAHGSCYPTPMYGPIDGSIDARTPKAYGVFPQQATTQMPSGSDILFSAASSHPSLEHDERVGLYPPALNSGPSRVLVDDSAPANGMSPT